MADDEMDDFTSTDDTTEVEETTEETEETTEEPTEESTENKVDEEELVEEGKEEVKDEEAEPKLEKPVFTKIKQEFPELFKKHPELRHAFFREQEFSKVFPTVDDAKEAANDAKSFEFINDELLAGRTENLLLSVAQVDRPAFQKIVDNFLPTLYKLSPDVFLGVTEPVIEHALRAMFKEGQTRGDKNLTLAAQHARNFLFGSHEFKDQARTQPTVDPEKEQLRQDRDTLRNRQMQIYDNDVQTTLRSQVESMILKGLDPEHKLTEFTRNKVLEATLAQVGAALESNPEHMALMNSLWNKALKSGLDPRHKASIIKAYISRAESLIPGIRAKIRAAALGMKTEPNKNPTRMTGGSSPSGPSKAKLDPKKIDWSKTSDLDVLNGAAKFKK
jgi:hypothetical protein